MVASKELYTAEQKVGSKDVQRAAASSVVKLENELVLSKAQVEAEMLAALLAVGKVVP